MKFVGRSKQGAVDRMPNTFRRSSWEDHDVVWQCQARRCAVGSGIDGGLGVTELSEKRTGGKIPLKRVDSRRN